MASTFASSEPFVLSTARRTRSCRCTIQATAIAVSPSMMWLTVTLIRYRQRPENLDRSEHTPSELRELDLADPSADDHAVATCQIFVDQKRKRGEPLADADPRAGASLGPAAYAGKSRCVRYVLTSRLVAVAPLGPART